MSKPRHDWWQNAVNMVKNYPARKAEYEELHRQSVTPALSGMPRGSDVNRATETTALRAMPPAKQKEYDAVEKAVAKTRKMLNGEAKIELIERMYWKNKRLRIEDVAPMLYISEATAKRWHKGFIYLVGVCFGYEI